MALSDYRPQVAVSLLLDRDVLRQAMKNAKTERLLLFRDKTIELKDIEIAGRTRQTGEFVVGRIQDVIDEINAELLERGG